MKFLVLNGPNLNLLGVREPGIYGEMNYDGMVERTRAACAAMGIETDFYQSNHEGDLVDAIQAARGVFDGIVVNPGAYTHTSIAILDALKAVAIPAAEVHVSDVTKRESFRQISYAGMACCRHVVGQGIAGYAEAARQLKEEIEGKGEN